MTFPQKRDRESTKTIELKSDREVVGGTREKRKMRQDGGATGAWEWAVQWISQHRHHWSLFLFSKMNVNKGSESVSHRPNSTTASGSKRILAAIRGGLLVVSSDPWITERQGSWDGGLIARPPRLRLTCKTGGTEGGTRMWSTVWTVICGAGTNPM